MQKRGQFTSCRVPPTTIATRRSRRCMQLTMVAATVAASTANEVLVDGGDETAVDNVQCVLGHFGLGCLPRSRTKQVSLPCGDALMGEPPSKDEQGPLR